MFNQWPRERERERERGREREREKEGQVAHRWKRSSEFPTAKLKFTREFNIAHGFEAKAFVLRE